MAPIWAEDRRYPATHHDTAEAGLERLERSREAREAREAGVERLERSGEAGNAFHD